MRITSAERRRPMTRHERRILGLGLAVIGLGIAAYVLVDRPGGEGWSVLSWALRIAMGEFARAESARWNRSLTPGHLLVIVWTGMFGWFAYLIGTGRRRPRNLTGALILAPLAGPALAAYVDLSRFLRL